MPVQYLNSFFHIISNLLFTNNPIIRQQISPPLLPLWSIGLITQFFDHFTDGRTSWTGDQVVARPLPKHKTTQTQKNAHTHQTSMP
jgi:hypothetical protein